MNILISLSFQKFETIKNTYYNNKIIIIIVGNGQNNYLLTTIINNIAIFYKNPLQL